jgi:hypothetical protein
VLDGEARAERAQPQADGGRGGGEQRRARPRGVLQVQQRRAEGAGERAGGQALHDPAGQQPAHPVGGEEQHHRRRLDDERDDQHRPAAHVVADPADDQQRQQQREGVDGEDDGDEARAEPELLGVHAVQRRGHARGEQHEDLQRRDGPEGGGAGQLTTRHGPLQAAAASGCSR